MCFFTDCRPEFEGAYTSTFSATARAFIETEVAANGGSLLLADAGGESGVCQDQVNACLNGVDVQCGEVAPTAECCTQLIPALQCVVGVANVCGDVGLAAQMQQSLATLDRDCPRQGAIDCHAAALACSQRGPLDCVAFPLTTECCNTVTPVIDCYFPIADQCLTPESADWVKNMKGYLDGTCPTINDFYF